MQLFIVLGFLEICFGMMTWISKTFKGTELQHKRFGEKRKQFRFSESKLCSIAALTQGSDVYNSQDYSSCLSADTFIRFIAKSGVGSA